MVLKQSNFDPEGTPGNIWTHFWTKSAAKHYRTHKTASPPTRNYQVQNVNSAMLRNPGLEVETENHFRIRFWLLRRNSVELPHLVT